MPKYAPGDYDGYEYQAEGDEADDCLKVLGQCTLGLLEKALHDYLRGFIMREGGGAKPEALSALLRRYKRGSWFETYCEFLTENAPFGWARPPIVVLGPADSVHPLC